MRNLIFLVILLLVSCSKTPSATGPADDVRAAINTQYVGVPRLALYASPSDTAPVITTYGYIESVSILARQGAWSEVRTFDGGSAWCIRRS